MAVSVWAEKYRILTMSSLGNKWKNIYTPYLTGIMDTAGTRGVETVIICKSPQTGGSEAGHNFVGWCIDRSTGPVMYVFPDEITARENMKDRIIPMIESSPRLKEYLTGKDDDTSSLRVNLTTMPIYIGWSGSVSRLGNKPIRTLILDELDKYRNSKNEATSETLAEIRTTTWRSRRHVVKISTPTTEDGAIWTAYTQEANARFQYWVPCPYCGVLQLMSFDNIAWKDKDTDKEPKSEDVDSNKLAYYICEHCNSHWSDNDRDRAVRKGEWREEASGLELKAHLANYQPVKVAFHIPAWISYFVSLSKVAWAALKYKETAKLDDLKTLQNQFKAEPWKEEHATRSEDEILNLADDRPRGAIPGTIKGAPRVACLLAGVDTQGLDAYRGHFRYIIRAFGFGDDEESWLIQCGSVDTFDALDELLWNRVYTDAKGTEYRVHAAMIDSMGRRYPEVVHYAIKNRGRIFPWQGVQKMTQPFNPSPQEYYPDTTGRKLKIPGGMILWRCDTTFFKNHLSYKLSMHPEDPGAFHLHSNDKGELNEYAREMSAEVFDDEKQIWVNPQNRPNHYWDCEVMCLALAYIYNVRKIPKPVEEDQKKQEKEPKHRMYRTDIKSRIGSWRR